ncbi:hypothetical protein [Streptomyces thermolineatus]|uniref:hypothetical protein n=1 Tax=Streptomyces thermolineatus TaxID=44033 RepID=UPI00384EE712
MLRGSRRGERRRSARRTGRIRAGRHLRQESDDRPGAAARPGDRTAPRWAAGDRGATAADYLGTVVVVAAIAVALSTTGIGTQVYEGIGTAICRLTGGTSCGTGNGAAGPGQGRTDSDYEPKLCNTASFEDRAGSEVKVGWFTFGEEYGFRQQEFEAPDGSTKVYLTFTDAASVGAKGSPKLGVRAGNLGAEKVDIGGGIKITNGDTWVFDSPEDAERFRDDLEELKTWEASMKHGGAGNWYGAYKYGEKYEEIDRKLGEQHISFGRIALEASAELALKKSAPDAKALGAQLGGKLKVAPEATVTNNNASDPPTRGYTYQFQLEYAGNAAVEAGPAQLKLEAGEVRTGTMTVTRYEDGSLARIDMTQSVEGRGNDSARLGGKTEEGNGGSGNASEKQRTTVITTNSISFPPGDDDPAVEADRRTAEDWLDGSGDNTAPFRYLFGDHAPTERPGADDPFGQLMFEKGESSRTRYLGISNAQEYGFEVNLGLSLGARINFEESAQELQEAEFLGAPKADGTRSYVPFSYCAN